MRRRRSRRHARDPARILGAQAFLHEERMVVALHHDERIGVAMFLGYVPRLAGRAAFSSYSDALALADRVEREPDVLPDDFSFRGLDGSRHSRQIAVQEIAERTLADEADAGRVLLRVVRQAGLERDAPHLAFLQLPD